MSGCEIRCPGIDRLILDLIWFDLIFEVVLSMRPDCNRLDLWRMNEHFSPASWGNSWSVFNQKKHGALVTRVLTVYKDTKMCFWKHWAKKWAVQKQNLGLYLISTASLGSLIWALWAWMDLQTGFDRIYLQPIKAAKGVAWDMSNLGHHHLVNISNPPHTS